MRKFEKQARLGMALLDCRRPGWRDKVKLDLLDMEMGQVTSHGCGCVLAQINPHGYYWDEIERLFGPLKDFEEGTDEVFGFAPPKDDIDKYAHQCEVLTVEWKRQISETTAKTTDPSRTNG